MPVENNSFKIGDLIKIRKDMIESFEAMNTAHKLARPLNRLYNTNKEKNNHWDIKAKAARENISGIIIEIIIDQHASSYIMDTKSGKSIETFRYNILMCGEIIELGSIFIEKA